MLKVFTIFLIISLLCVGGALSQCQTNQLSCYGDCTKLTSSDICKETDGSDRCTSCDGWPLEDGVCKWNCSKYSKWCGKCSETECLDCYYTRGIDFLKDFTATCPDVTCSLVNSLLDKLPGHLLLSAETYKEELATLALLCVSQYNQNCVIEANLILGKGYCLQKVPNCEKVVRTTPSNCLACERGFPFDLKQPWNMLSVDCVECENPESETECNACQMFGYAFDEGAGVCVKCSEAIEHAYACEYSGGAIKAANCDKGYKPSGDRKSCVPGVFCNFPMGATYCPLCDNFELQASKTNCHECEPLRGPGDLPPSTQESDPTDPSEEDSTKTSIEESIPSEPVSLEKDSSTKTSIEESIPSDSESQGEGSSASGSKKSSAGSSASGSKKSSAGSSTSADKTSSNSENSENDSDSDPSGSMAISSAFSLLFVLVL